MVCGHFSRTLKRLSIYRGNYKGNTFSSVILRPRVLVWSGVKENENRTSVPKIVAADIVILDC